MKKEPIAEYTGEPPYVDQVEATPGDILLYRIALGDAEDRRSIAAKVSPNLFHDGTARTLFTVCRDHADKEHSYSTLRPFVEAAGQECLALYERVADDENRAGYDDALTDAVIESAVEWGRRERLSRVVADATRQLGGEARPEDIRVRLLERLDEIGSIDTGTKYRPATCALAEPRENDLGWVVDEIILANELTMLFGDGGSMKSTLCLVAACAVAGGYRFCNRFTVSTPRAVLIVSQEDSASVLTNRIVAICRGHGWNEKKVRSNIHYHALEDVSLGDPRWGALLMGEIERLGAGLVILDTLQELVDGDQNSASDMGPYIKTMRRFSRPTKAAVLLAHHAGKKGVGKRDIDRVRGSSAFYSAVRGAYLIENRENDSAVTVTNLKLSRTGKIAPFVVGYTIDAEPGKRELWKSARFEYVSLRQAQFDEAQSFILSHLDTSGERQTSTQIRGASKGSGINQPAIAAALSSLATLGVIDFIDGPNNAKLWGRKPASEPAQKTGQPGQPPQLSLPGNPEACPATASDAAWGLPASIGGNPAGIHRDGRATTLQLGAA